MKAEFITCGLCRNAVCRRFYPHKAIACQHFLQLKRISGLATERLLRAVIANHLTSLLTRKAKNDPYSHFYNDFLDMETVFFWEMCFFSKYLNPHSPLWIRGFQLLVKLAVHHQEAAMVSGPEAIDLSCPFLVTADSNVCDPLSCGKPCFWPP